MPPFLIDASRLTNFRLNTAIFAGFAATGSREHVHPGDLVLESVVRSVGLTALVRLEHLVLDTNTLCRTVLT